jgi:hypothetical protein
LVRSSSGPAVFQVPIQNQPSIMTVSSSQVPSQVQQKKFHGDFPLATTDATSRMLRHSSS